MTSETDLIIKAQKGDSSAFEELIYKYDKNVLSLALKYAGSSDDAKDIYQEVFIRVFKSLKNFQFRSEFSTWLYRITTNVCLTFRKTRSRYSNISIYENDEAGTDEYREIKSDEGSSPHSHAEHSELSRVINDALENLSPKQKLSFVLKNYEGYKIREIAVMLDCGEGTIKKYLFDANQRMRKYLKDFYN